MSIPKRVESRIKSGLRKFRPILEDARKADRSEEDTVTIVRDFLAEVLGYDKYADITGEYQIRGTFCDLAVKVDDKLKFLIEVKAVDRTLKEAHLRQATDYAAKEGIEWVILTNGVEWRVHRMLFEQPVRHEHVFTFDLLGNGAELANMLYVLSREGAKKHAIRQYHAQIRAVNRYSLAAVIISEPVLNVIRRELKRASPGVRIELEDVEDVIAHEVIKRDVMDSPEVQDAIKRIQKARTRKLRDRRESQTTPAPSAGREA
ncbi:MAG: type I restriction enzyme HsdR N-terminal domain-containing protein [Phycisphaerae bacterium]